MTTIATGCATSTRPDPFDSLPEVEVEAEGPATGCEWPEIREEDGRLWMDEAGFRAFLACREIAEANSDIARLNAESVRQLSEAYTTTKRMAERQADYDAWRIEELERDKRALWWESVLLKVGVVVGFAL